MKLGDRWSQALKPDAQAFDEVRILTVPRYKQSGLSGDEWRISATVQLIRKGKVVVEEVHWRDVETAAKFLAWIMAKAGDEGKGYFAGEGDVCDQEGCSAPATVFLQKKKDWCCRCGEGKEASIKEFRKFCEHHKQRGDCGLDDADENYIVLAGDPRKEEEVKP